MRPTVAVVGASGTVGDALATRLQSDHVVVATGHQNALDEQLDVRDGAAVAAFLDRARPETVVLCAALSNVARCEAEPAESEAVNLRGAENVARACGSHRRLVFFSSDAVFSDRQESWSESDAPDPPSTYGRHKALAEAACQRHCAEPLVLRTARVYRRERGDGKFVDIVIDRLRRGQQVTAPVDTPGNPTFLDDLVDATVELIGQGESGIWHLAGPPVDSLYATAEEIVRTFGFDASLLRAVARDEGSDLPRISARLDTSRAQRAGLRFRPLADGLAAIS